VKCWGMGYCVLFDKVCHKSILGEVPTLDFHIRRYPVYNASQKHESTLLHTIRVCTEIIFDSRPFIYNWIFLKKKLFKKIVAHIFTLLLTHFEKLVNYSKHSESLKFFWKRSNRCFWRKMSSFMKSSVSLKSHCDLNISSIWTQKVPKEA